MKDEDGTIVEWLFFIIKVKEHRDPLTPNSCLYMWNTSSNLKIETSKNYFFKEAENVLECILLINWKFKMICTCNLQEYIRRPNGP